MCDGEGQARRGARGPQEGSGGSCRPRCSPALVRGCAPSSPTWRPRGTTQLAILLTECALQIRERELGCTPAAPPPTASRLNE
eukprot:scaffold3159_cov393-Prasinococcus_capsulatus_cf.AAC.2